MIPRHGERKMAIIVNKDEVLPTEEGDLTVWRLIGNRKGNADLGASAGLVIYGAPAGGAVPPMGGAHDLGEFHYVLSGTGFLLEDGARYELKVGDALVIEPGRRHVMWGRAEAPLVAYYVALTSPLESTSESSDRS
jgi:uncharacterized cupin superfamily protein